MEKELATKCLKKDIPPGRNDTKVRIADLTTITV